MLNRPELLLHHRSGRSTNEAHRFLEETTKDQVPILRRASIGTTSSTMVTNRSKNLDEPLDHTRKTDSSYSLPIMWT